MEDFNSEYKLGLDWVLKCDVENGIKRRWYEPAPNSMPVGEHVTFETDVAILDLINGEIEFEFFDKEQNDRFYLSLNLVHSHASILNDKRIATTVPERVAYIGVQKNGVVEIRKDEKIISVVHIVP